MNKKLVILHGKNGFFGQTRKPWVSMDLKILISKFRENGFHVENYEYQEVINQNIEIRNSIVFYSFSQRENVREYIKDLIQHLSWYDNIIIPSYEMLLCHENKGFQELLKKKNCIKSLDCKYYEDKEGINFNEIKFPVVLKKVDGSNGKNVYLVRTVEELKQKLSKFEHLDTFSKIDLFRRRYLRKKKTYEHYPDYANRKDYEEYKDYIIMRDNFILQEFVPNLQYDFRVLALYDKFLVTRRLNKENDFRASGAKRYDFTFETDTELLNFSREIFSKFDTPILSMDICKSGNNYYLIEYQAIHFGINVVVRSKGYYKYENEEWTFFENKNNIEEEIVYSVTKYIKNKIKD